MQAMMLVQHERDDVLASFGKDHGRADEHELVEESQVQVFGKFCPATYRKATVARMSVRDTFSRSARSTGDMRNVLHDMQTSSDVISMIFHR